MKAIENKINGIIIPTGTFEQDKERFLAACKYNSQKCGGKANFIASGIGPDINEVLKYSKDEGYGLKDDIGDLDVHHGLWDSLYNYANLLEKPRFFGIDRNSVTSAENLSLTFPDVENDSGKYAIVSYPLHLLRFRFLQRAMKLSNRLSKKVEFEYVPTKSWLKQTKDEWVYGLVALGKELIGRSFLKPANLRPA